MRQMLLEACSPSCNLSCSSCETRLHPRSPCLSLPILEQQFCRVRANTSFSTGREAQSSSSVWGASNPAESWRGVKAQRRPFETPSANQRRRIRGCARPGAPCLPPLEPPRRGPVVLSVGCLLNTQLS